jgi:predicted aldo/keto reductase-like oxidoreductase
MLGVDSAVASKAVRAAIVDGKHQIDEACNKLEVAQKEARLLKEEYSRVKSELVLERKLSTVRGKKKEYLARVLKNKTAEFITENFDYASTLFDKSETERLHTIKEEATYTTTSTSVDRPVFVEEQVKARDEDFDTQSYMSPYLTELNKF